MASVSKYATSVFRGNDQWRGERQERFEREPLPDQEGECDKTSQVFLPSNILDLSLKVFYPKPSQHTLSSISFLAWIPLHQAEDFFNNARREEEELAEEDNAKEFWSKHPLFVENTRDELVQMCSSNKLLGTGKKHELMEQMAKATEGDSASKGRDCGEGGASGALAPPLFYSNMRKIIMN